MQAHKRKLPRTPDDDMLLQNYRISGQPHHIAELYRRYAHLIYGSCLYYLKNEEDSRDMVMHIFEKLLRILPDQNISTFKTWLFTLTRNECIDFLRKQKKGLRDFENWKNFEKNQRDFMKNEGFLRLNEEPPLTEYLEEAINNLSEKQQTCIRLFFFEKKRYKEIATITGYSFKEVKSYLQNGKQQLRQFLKDHKTR